jgi:hypothetical protein
MDIRLAKMQTIIDRADARDSERFAWPFSFGFSFYFYFSSARGVGGSLA